MKTTAETLKIVISDPPGERRPVLDLRRGETPKSGQIRMPFAFADFVAAMDSLTRAGATQYRAHLILEEVGEDAGDAPRVEDPETTIKTGAAMICAAAKQRED